MGIGGGALLAMGLASGSGSNYTPRCRRCGLEYPLGYPNTVTWWQTVLVLTVVLPTGFWFVSGVCEWIVTFGERTLVQSLCWPYSVSLLWHLFERLASRLW